MYVGLSPIGSALRQPGCPSTSVVHSRASDAARTPEVVWPCLIFTRSSTSWTGIGRLPQHGGRQQLSS